MIRPQQKGVAHEHEIAFRGLHGVGDLFFRFGLLIQTRGHVGTRNAIGFDFDAGIFVLERFDDRLVRIAGQRSVPSYLALAFCSAVRGLFRCK